MNELSQSRVKVASPALSDRLGRSHLYAKVAQPNAVMQQKPVENECLVQGRDLYEKAL